MKKFFLVLLVIFVALIGLLVITTYLDGQLDWPENGLAQRLPEPPTGRGEVKTDNDGAFSAVFTGVDASAWREYRSACQNMGYAVDAVEVSDDYRAYNDEGYCLSLRFSESSEEISVELSAPPKMEKIGVGTLKLNSYLPRLHTDLVHIDQNYDNSLDITIGESSLEKYQNYVSACKSRGFVQDLEEEERTFSGKKDGKCAIWVSYLGGGYMRIVLDADVPAPESTESGGASESSWVAFLEEYEDWVDSYVALVRRYQANPADMTILREYTEMAQQVSEWAQRAAQIKGTLSGDDAIEFAKTMTRIAQKLSSVAY